jgi:2-keto-4-pentenoate hydratase/2-oxohepta-3-ene-1,7-dioic acid hydratase in catechol pathway
MKLFRFREAGKEFPGVMVDNNTFDVRSFGEDYNEAFFESDGITRLQRLVNESSGHLPKLEGNITFAAPFKRPSKIVCIGLNYADHARETGATPPTEPVIFMKATSSLVGPFDNIVIPRNSQKTDWEVELAVVIGKKASYVEEEEALPM